MPMNRPPSPVGRPKADVAGLQQRVAELERELARLRGARDTGPTLPEEKQTLPEARGLMR